VIAITFTNIVVIVVKKLIGVIQMSKMTDKEIIQALDDRMYCGKWIGKGFLDKKDFQILKDALELINRQQEKIEYMQGEREVLLEDMQVRNNQVIEQQAEIERLERHTEMYHELRAEIIKELEAKIHEKLHEAEMHGNFEPVVTREMFDSVVKEMVGEGNG
jgi:TolA-binding protein